MSIYNLVFQCDWLQLFISFCYFSSVPGNGHIWQLGVNEMWAGEHCSNLEKGAQWQITHSYPHQKKKKQTSFTLYPHLYTTAHITTTHGWRSTICKCMAWYRASVSQWCSRRRDRWVWEDCVGLMSDSANINWFNRIYKRQLRWCKGLCLPL